MKKAGSVIVVVAALAVGSLLAAAAFKPYPGARLDERATRDANAAAKQAGMGSVATVYTTGDPFAKVAAFYKGIAAEYSMPRASGTAGKPKKYPGYDLYEAYFIFDGAPDLSQSRLWVKVQRPAIALYAEGPESEEVKDVTVILVSEKK